MGYYADGGGEIEFKRPPTNEERVRIYAIVDYWFEGAYWDTDTALSLSVYYDGKYHSDFEDDMQKLDPIVPIDDGLLEFKGEDGAHWRLVFDKATRRFHVEPGILIYESEKPLTWNNAPEFVGQIIDGFEDFLESKGINIPNPEKADSDDPAIIYGTDYGELQSYIEASLINWGLLPNTRQPF